VAQGVPPDTSYVCAVDAEGNVFSATPSDPCAHPDMGAPIVPGLGLIISARGSQSRLDERHPASLEPGKRPRLTPNPALALKDGRPFLAFGTPGGDGQTQAMVQVFLNVVEWGMDPQEAIEQPRVFSRNFPDSFAPHAYSPGALVLEARLGEEARADLAVRGHAAELMPDWSPAGCGVCAIQVHPSGLLVGGADPRREAYADGW
jgi:gamma-glutamyltranspeptidase/glutathione hydrolase